MLITAVISDGSMHRTEVVPHQHVTFRPAVRVAILRLQLVLEQKPEHLIALALRPSVDTHGIAGVRIEHETPGERVPQKNRMRYRRLLESLLFGQRRAIA